MIYVEEKVKIEAERIIVYKRLNGYVRKKNKTSFTTENNKKGKVQGKLSESAVKKIKKIINVWLTAYQYYYLSKKVPIHRIRQDIKFITLTLSSTQNHDDKFIKRYMLNDFLTVLRKKYNVRNYLWVAETQQNGNLHFHIITNVYISHVAIRKIWNKIQDRYHYLDAYNAKKGHKNANSTDIHALQKIKNMAAYLTKEATKGQQNRPIDGKIWGCSKNLLELKPYETYFNGHINDALNHIAEQKNTKIFSDNFFAVIFFDSIHHFDNVNFYDKTEIYEHYIKQMELLQQDTPGDFEHPKKF